jgi:hypothetical protein
MIFLSPLSFGEGLGVRSPASLRLSALLLQYDTLCKITKCLTRIFLVTILVE